MDYKQQRWRSGLFLTVFLVCAGRSDAQTRLYKASSLILPGQRVGRLSRGDSRQRVQQLFPVKQNVDEAWPDSQDECGTVINWVDLESRGNVSVHLREARVFQIDSATARFKMASGLTTGATPEQVRRQFKGLRAFNLSNGTSEAEGGRPLVYWVDMSKGIGFAFAYYRKKKSWYLYHTIVFAPGADICPNPEALSPSDKRELNPYSLNPESGENGNRE